MGDYEKSQLAHQAGHLLYKGIIAKKLIQIPKGKTYIHTYTTTHAYRYYTHAVIKIYS